jgi:hypothetical protein
MVAVARAHESLRRYLWQDESTTASETLSRRLEPGRSVTREARGLIAGRDRDVTCQVGPNNAVVGIEGVGTFAVAGDGRTIEVVDEENPTNPALLDEAALGPPLLLALALQGVSCLHAGAVAVNDGVVAWLGPSGAGKSTLAAFFEAEMEGWARCADDLLPVEESDESVWALPHFPQLKLPPDAQWCGDMPERLPLRTVYVLGEADNGVAIEPLASSDAVVELLQQTAVWSLFPPELAERHLALCACIAESVPVSRLAFPRRFNVLPEVAAAIAADLRR